MLVDGVRRFYKRLSETCEGSRKGRQTIKEHSVVTKDFNGRIKLWLHNFPSKNK